MLVPTNLFSQFPYDYISLDYFRTGDAAIKKFLKMVRTLLSRK
jgi:hypothetical protein